MWDYIKLQGVKNIGHPWMLMGDFNATMKPSDSEGGDPNWSTQKEEFSLCLHQAEIHPVPYRGIKYTWHNRQMGDNNILKKLDWILGNTTMATTWPNAQAQFLPRNISDHSPMILQLNQNQSQPKLAFKFLNLWAERDDFLPQVEKVWQEHMLGSPMYKLTAKMHKVKACLKNWHKFNRSHITSRVTKAKAAWDEAQKNMDANPRSKEAISAEKDMANRYAQLSKEEESFYKQRSRVQWLTLGDRNTAFFHISLMHRRMRNRITSLMDG
ncbi:hypothetical protein OIU84_026379 [Salix udensis]|uniref:Endonuclease/exonuclease/phosphatase domain-containing protein n=1 Tax=Salix udensis TaxID=889485 RepID=A0AAD6PEN0_9ROSI|nr:hypothetical protein OIU84_026379 [Salix udensis]